MPRIREAETLAGVDLAVLVDDNRHGLGAAEAGEPGGGVGRGAVGDGDAMDGRVGGGEVAESEEGARSDCGWWEGGC